uniref:Uncharacterized protein n=1 Tax=Arundo donax TaxID=35708 RepID=A0A0A8Y4E3_ARUDO
MLFSIVGNFFISQCW